jgi:hypothetical protein
MTTGAEILARLRPEVRDFTYEGFSLASDLGHLAAVLQAEAPEATIFYGGRILEALSGQAVERAGGEAKPNPFANLTYLAEATLLKRDAAYWAHGLRRLGNEVRHLNRPIGMGEAELAAQLVERWLAWYFCGFEIGTKLPRLTPMKDKKPLFPAKDEVLAGLLLAIDDPEEREQLRQGLTAPQQEALARAPTAACVLAERWIESGALAQAKALIDALGEKLKDELRFLQLMALHANRAKDGERTIALLRPKVSAGLQDEETMGILAGGYKRVWSKTKKDETLKESHRLYRQGFRAGKEASYYLGINAATTAFLLGDLKAAAELGGKVAAIIETQSKPARKLGRDPLREDYWLAATLAEAQLLAGQRDEAIKSYGVAFSYPASDGRFDTTQANAEDIIRARGEAPIDFAALKTGAKPPQGA